jgi:hypothetical protein
MLFWLFSFDHFVTVCKLIFGRCNRAVGSFIEYVNEGGDIVSSGCLS